MKYTVEIRLRPFDVEVPNDADEETTDRLLEEAVEGAYLEELVSDWNAFKAYRQ